jgi:hypothetical protein
MAGVDRVTQSLADFAKIVRITKTRGCFTNGMMQHGPDGGQLEHGGGRSGEPVIACGDCAIDLEMTDEALDLVALPIDALVPADRHPAGASPAGSQAGIRPLKLVQFAGTSATEPRAARVRKVEDAQFLLSEARVLTPRS